MNYSRLIIIVTDLMSAYGKTAKPKFLDNVSGHISPGKISAWFTIFVGIFCCSLGVFLALFQGEWILGGLLILLFSAVAGFMLPSLFSIHDVFWSQDYVEGPSKMLGPSLGRKRENIKWSEIERTGITVTQYWYVETSDKRRVYWSYLYKGYGALHKALETHRPDLPKF